MFLDSSMRASSYTDLQNISDQYVYKKGTTIKIQATKQAASWSGEVCIVYTITTEYTDLINQTLAFRVMPLQAENWSWEKQRQTKCPFLSCVCLLYVLLQQYGDSQRYKIKVYWFNGITAYNIFTWLDAKIIHVVEAMFYQSSSLVLVHNKLMIGKVRLVRQWGALGFNQHRFCCFCL